MSVRNFIRQNLPEAWDKAATELRMKNELIERIYAMIPQHYRNKYYYEGGIRIVKRIFAMKCDIIHKVDATDMNLTKWGELNNKIKAYEEACR